MVDPQKWLPFYERVEELWPGQGLLARADPPDGKAQAKQLLGVAGRVARDHGIDDTAPENVLAVLDAWVAVTPYRWWPGTPRGAVSRLAAWGRDANEAAAALAAIRSGAFRPQSAPTRVSDWRY